jgi:hypothetical protein
MRKNEDITIEDARIAFRNFEGREDKYNPKGKRNFAVILPHEVAHKMLADGWNVKYLKARDEDEDPQPYIQVKVAFENKPPKLVQVTRRGKTMITEDLAETLDWVDIEYADVTITPYDYDINGKAGRAAYVKTLVLKIEEDYLMDKWDAIIEGWKTEDRQKELPAGEEYIDGEFYETPEIGR